ncbi:hypothetical protein GCM10009547_45620 [Sporichthya brevicatena]|uniref:Uncharacterized protein n=1 Tax=Sporichthya brevicatena TaxID=171442 RepID=A0ABN1HB23_9ACTN
MGATPKVMWLTGGVAGALLAAGMPAGAAAAAPAAGTAASGKGTVVAKVCSTTAHGVPLKVRMRFNMASKSDVNKVRSLRVRVSHPDGVGKYRSSRVRSVTTTFLYESEKADDRIGSAVWADRRGDRAVYNKSLRQEMGSVTTVVTFKLKNGKRTAVSCTQQFPKD